MSQRTLSDVEDDLARVRELETDDAVAVLGRAREDLDAMAQSETVDQDHRRTLETRLDQLSRTVRNRGAYDGGLGAAMNPDEDDAP